MEDGREDIEPIGRRVDVELSDDELLLRKVCRELIVNSDPCSCDVFLWCSNFFRASSGSPSHLLFTLGTCSGSFCADTLGRPTALGRPPVFAAAAFFCCSANCSSAEVEGSFKVRNPSMPFFFLLLVCCGGCWGLLPCDDPLLRALSSMVLLRLEFCDVSLMPLSRFGDAVRVLE